MERGARLLSIEETAQQLKVTRDVVHRLAAAGRLRYIWQYGGRRFPLADVEAFRDGRQGRGGQTR